MSSVSALRFNKQIPAGITSLKKARQKSATDFLSGKHAVIVSLLLCFTLYLVFFFCLSQRKSLVTSLEETNKKLKAENRELTREWTRLSSPERIAYLAKNKLGLRQPDKEQVIFLR